MTSMPTGGVAALESPLTTSVGLSATLAQVTADAFARVVTHLADPMAADSRATYAAWLRHQVTAWNELHLPAVPLAAVDWPLSSVPPECLDVVGLLMADLRELSPRMRPTLAPRQRAGAESPQPGTIVACVDLCVRFATPAAQLLGPARALTAGLTQVGSSTRYLTGCARLADRGERLRCELDGWAVTAGPAQTRLAVLTAQQLTDRLATALDARVRRGW